MAKYRLHISPCPNDTFIFDAMLHGRIDTEGSVFDLHFADIEELNSDAERGIADITKVSYAVVPCISEEYRLLRSGGALGCGNGPLLVSSRPLKREELQGCCVAIPGEKTTANMLMGLIFPELSDKRVMLFSDIADAVASGDVDAGVLIHEGRFTYREKGLRLVADLGREWERISGLPLPLGAIAIKRTIPEEETSKIGRILRRSVEYALANPKESYNFVKSHAQEMDDGVIKSHIDLFVNDFSIDIGEGRRAVEQLLYPAMGDSVRHLF